MPYTHELEVAIEAVTKASVLCKHVQGSFTKDESLSKSDRSPVTVADYGSQTLINIELMKQFPNDGIVSEEDSSMLKTEEGAAIFAKIKNELLSFHAGIGDEDILSSIDHGKTAETRSDRFWTIDPIDGTKGFIRGDHYAVALALIEEGEVVLGVLGCPNIGNSTNLDIGAGAIFYSVKGEGAFSYSLEDKKKRKISVVDVTEPSDTTFLESVEFEHSSHDHSSKVAEILNITQHPVRVDGQCKYAMLARGDAGIYLRLPVRDDYQEKIWDHAAGYIIVNESGGKVTDIYGKRLDFSKGHTLAESYGIIATNGKIHDLVLSAVQIVFGIDVA